MSTDSTELTFVRCPSCRSLVPAVSTRCRMCGASLDSGAQAEEDKSGQKSGRVRQRTMSQPKSELSSAADQMRGDEAEVEAVEPDPLGYSDEVEAEGEIDDPLSAYIEEVDEQADAPAKQAKPVEAPKPAQSAPVETTWQKVAPKAEPVAPAQAAPVVNGTSVVADTKPEAEEPRVIIETGGKRGGKPGGLSFGGGKPRDERQTERHDERPREEAPRREQPEQRQASAPPPREQQPRQEAPRPQQQAQDNRNQNRDNRRDRDQREGRDRDNRDHSRDQQQNKQHNPQPQQKAQQGPRKAETSGRRLFGWLVSYTNPDGQATELREGKFFVTRSSLKENDLILDDDSISTPHAMVVVSFDGGFTIQDLMSERGIGIKRKGSDRYETDQETIKPGHGDWIRFGNIEYLVSFIAPSGSK